jgi:glycosyltransferase involved in cell wall biosynthesis
MDYKKTHSTMNEIKNQTRTNHPVARENQSFHKPQDYDMVVLCHLRWEFVYQRPQHIISRLANDYKILFIEEPIVGSNSTLKKINDQLHVLQPQVEKIEDIPEVLPQFIKNKNIPIGWFYSASFSPLLSYFDFNQIVYDCMDELSLFKGAPLHLIEQEKYLIGHVDILFTGGKSLYESKKQLHSNVYCFPSSVDYHHFSKAKNGIVVPNDIKNISSPIVGYFGVIDERIDLQLLHQTAQKASNVSFVMIGPLAKIEASELPQEPNIHYLGMKTYQELPNYLKHFNIAMMPFALNEATKYISPTKTLEYMAANKPIISTKITDVVRDYQHCVALISSAEEFYQNIISTLNNSNTPSIEKDYQEILEKTSWNNTVEHMKVIMKKLINQ